MNNPKIRKAPQTGNIPVLRGIINRQNDGFRSYTNDDIGNTHRCSGRHCHAACYKLMIWTYDALYRYVEIKECGKISHSQSAILYWCRPKRMNLHANSACTYVRPVLFLSHPDYTVGSGFSPDPPPGIIRYLPGHGLRACRQSLAVYHLNTAGGEFHPAPRIKPIQM